MFDHRIAQCAPIRVYIVDIQYETFALVSLWAQCNYTGMTV